MRRILLALAATGLGATLLGMLLGLLVPLLWIAVVPGLFAAWFLLGRAAWRIVSALGDVLQRKDMAVLGGLVRLVAWDPTEGVVILKHKALLHVDEDMTDGGGVEVLLPLLGEELAMRAPLEIQTLQFHDDNVLTREYVPLVVKGTLYWRIVDLERFYLFVSKEIHYASDRRARELRTADQDVSGDRHHVRTFDGDGAAWRQTAILPTPPQAARQVEAACEWLRYLAEEQTREVVAGVATGLLFGDRIAAEVTGGARSETDGVEGPEQRPESSRSYRTATDGLAKTIQGAVGRRVESYGIEVHGVSLQEVEMPGEVREASVAACRSAYSLIVKRREAAGRRMELEAERDMLGQDGLVVKEVAAKAKMPPGFIIGSAFEEFISRTFRHGMEAAKAAALPAPGDDGPARNGG